jgi:acyl-CoA synthetase (AMP-forming)/AMP-acid ligase II
LDIYLSLKKAARLYPAQTAVVDGNRRLNYAEVHRRIRSLACFLNDHSVSRGDRIAILDDNSLEFFESYYAAAAIGAVACPINTRLSAREVQFILEDSGATWLFTRDRFAPLVEALELPKSALEGIVWIESQPKTSITTEAFVYKNTVANSGESFSQAKVDGDDLAHLFYTSGTSGRPKGVMLSHQNVCIHALSTIAELGLTDADIWGHFAPMFHLADAWAVFAITWVGGCHVMSPHFTPESTLAAFEKHQISITNLVPTMLNLMVKHPDVHSFDYSSLRAVLSGGAPIAGELVRSICDVFQVDYIQTYGMTETCPYLTFSILKASLKKLSPEEQLAFRSTTGRPNIVVELEVMDETGNPVAPSGKQVGEIWVRGDTVTQGYWNNPAETRAAFQDDWLKTGDLAVIDEEGYVNIVDRKKDVIISGGENIYSTEVENALYKNVKILEAAVFSVPDEKWGEAVKAAVVLRPGESASSKEIIDSVKKHLSPFKAPKSITFLTELPRTGSGKIFKQALKYEHEEK